MESSPEVHSLAPKVDFVSVFQFVLLVVGDDVGEGSCVDSVGGAVAVVLCPLVDGALEEVGAFGPHGACSFFGVDDMVGVRVEAEPYVAWVLGRRFCVAEDGRCVGWKVGVGMVFWVDIPKEARFVSRAMSVDVVAVGAALLASEERPAHYVGKVLGVVITVAHGAIAAVPSLPVLAVTSVPAR